MSALLQIRAQLDQATHRVVELEKALAEHPGYPSIAANLDSAVRIKKKLEAQFEDASHGGISIEPTRTPANMSGTFTFYAFSYLLNGANSLSTSATEQPAGSGYCRVSAALLSAFAIEAYLNHVGEEILPFWAVVEPKLPWKDKLTLVAQALHVEIDYGKRPFQSLNALFKLRNGLAHGKTVTQEMEYLDTGFPGDGFRPMDPDWLRQFWTEEAVARVLTDTRAIITLLHKAAGLNECTLDRISDGDFAEQRSEQRG